VRVVKDDQDRKILDRITRTSRVSELKPRWNRTGFHTDEKQHTDLFGCCFFIRVEYLCFLHKFGY
jgi:hypothetical protein